MNIILLVGVGGWGRYVTLGHLNIKLALNSVLHHPKVFFLQWVSLYIAKYLSSADTYLAI